LFLFLKKNVESKLLNFWPGQILDLVVVLIVVDMADKLALEQASANKIILINLIIIEKNYLYIKNCLI
jgi:hypothetical protein